MAGERQCPRCRGVSRKSHLTCCSRLSFLWSRLLHSFLLQHGLGRLTVEKKTTFGQADWLLCHLVTRSTTPIRQRRLCMQSSLPFLSRTFTILHDAWMNLSESGEALRDGIKSMVPALIILTTMAWSIGTIIKTPKSEGGLGLGYFLSKAVSGSEFLSACCRQSCFVP